MPKATQIKDEDGNSLGAAVLELWAWHGGMMPDQYAMMELAKRFNVPYGRVKSEFKSNLLPVDMMVARIIRQHTKDGRTIRPEYPLDRGVVEILAKERDIPVETVDKAIADFMSDLPGRIAYEYTWQNVHNREDKPLPKGLLRKLAQQYKTPLAEVTAAAETHHRENLEREQAERKARQDKAKEQAEKAFHSANPPPMEIKIPEDPDRDARFERWLEKGSRRRPRAGGGRERGQGGGSLPKVTISKGG